MTREEAIEIMKQTKEVVSDYHRKAFDVAVKALEQESCEDCLFKNEWQKIGKLISVVLEKQTEQEINSDYISREKTLEKFCDYVGSGMSMNDFDALYDIVAKMPSVQPKTDRRDGYMDRLTKEQIQKDCIGDVYTSKEFLEHVKRKLITSYDGIGFVHNGYEELDNFDRGVFSYIRSMSEEEFCEKYPYVCWYNK